MRGDVRAIVVLALAVLSMSIGHSARAGSVSTTIPDVPDPAAHYLFYMHGEIVEKEGDNASSRRYGPYKYDAILEAFAKRNFMVIGEVRPEGTRRGEYAGKVAGEVRRLLAAGVPPRNITVAGHSRGGQLAMEVASFLRNPDINFVALAACIDAPGRGEVFREWIATDAKNMAGRMLSARDEADRLAGSCGDAFRNAPALKAEERVLKTGQGHGLFYTPQAIWLDLVEAWALGRS